MDTVYIKDLMNEMNTIKGANTRKEQTKQKIMPSSSNSKWHKHQNFK